MIPRALAAMTLASVAAAAAAQPLACPQMPRPEGSYQWVAEAIVYNGLPMRIQRADGKQPPEQVLAFYRRQWSGDAGLAPIEYTSGIWRVIAAARSGCFYTVQVQAAGAGYTGFLGVSGAPGPALKANKALPMLTGSTLVNDIEHRDPGKTGRTVVLNNGFSPQANADFYRRRLPDEGWQAVTDREMTTAKGPGITMVMKRDLAELSLVIARQGQTTTVLANFLDNP